MRALPGGGCCSWLWEGYETGWAGSLLNQNAITEMEETARQANGLAGARAAAQQGGAALQGQSARLQELAASDPGAARQGDEAPPMGGPHHVLLASQRKPLMTRNAGSKCVG